MLACRLLCKVMWILSYNMWLHTGIHTVLKYVRQYMCVCVCYRAGQRHIYTAIHRWINFQACRNSSDMYMIHLALMRVWVRTIGRIFKPIYCMWLASTSQIPVVSAVLRVHTLLLAYNPNLCWVVQCIRTFRWIFHQLLGRSVALAVGSDHMILLCKPWKYKPTLA